MHYLLAQSAGAISEAVEQGVKAGLETTAVSRPSEWLMALLCFALVLVFLRSMTKRDERFENMIGSYSEERKEARKECHEHNERMSTASASHAAALTVITHDLKSTSGQFRESTEDLKGAVHDLRGILQPRQTLAELQALKEAKEMGS